MHRTVTTAPRRRPDHAPDPHVLPPALVHSSVGPLVPFADAMALLADAGIPIAPFVVADADISAGEVAHLGDRLVVKLADVAHRTELGAVAVGVAPADVPGTAARLRAVARAHGAPETIAVQAMVEGRAEVFAGLHAESHLGPVVLLGAGGVLVEVLGGAAGRLLPLDDTTARYLVDEVAGRAGALRGQRPWPTEALVGVVYGIAALWAEHGGWLSSADVNPLIITEDGVVAVDVLLTVRENGADA